MAALIIPSRRVVQPQGPAEVDWGNPLALGANVWTPQRPFALQSANNVQPGAEIAYSSAPISAAGVGRQWTRSANAGINFGLQQIIRQNVGVTVLVLAAPRSQTALKVPVSQRVASGAFTQTELVFNCQDIAGITTATAGSVLLANYSNIGTGVAAASQIDGQPHCWVAGNSSTSGYIFRDGVSQTLAVNVRTPAALTVSTQRTRIGNIADDGGTTYAHDDPLYLVVVWDRMLSDSEARAVSANPWQLFRPLQRRIWVPVAGGGGIIQTVAFTLEDVSAAVSQNLSHAQSLTGTLDDVTVSISQTAQHSQALSATLDDIAFSASQTVGNATNQTLAITLDGVTVAAAQTLSHSQALAAALDGVTVAASQTLSHSQALAATLDGITVAISQSAAPSSKEQSLAVVLDGIQVAIAQEGPANLIDTHDGFWAKEWARIRAREKRKYQEEIQERVEEIQDEIAEVEQQIVEVKQAPKPKKATPARDFYAEQARIVEHLIARRNQLIDEEDEELLLLL